MVHFHNIYPDFVKQYQKLCSKEDNRVVAFTIFVVPIKILNGKLASFDKYRSAAISNRDMPPITTRSITFFSGLWSSINIFGITRASSASFLNATLVVEAAKLPKSVATFTTLCIVEVLLLCESIDVLLLTEPLPRKKQKKIKLRSYFRTSTSSSAWLGWRKSRKGPGSSFKPSKIDECCEGVVASICTILLNRGAYP